LLIHHPPPTHIPTLSLHDALPIFTPASTLIRVDLPAPFSPISAWISPARNVRSTSCRTSVGPCETVMARISTVVAAASPVGGRLDRKSTRLNSSHVSISYAVFCLK